MARSQPRYSSVPPSRCQHAKRPDAHICWASWTATDTGLKEDYIAAVSGRLLPGHSALVAEVDEFSTLPVDEAVWRNGGVIFRHPSSYYPV